MPLTSVLKDRHHWLSVFLARRFGHLRRFVARVRDEAKSMETGIPLGDENRPMARTVGKAVDFGLRLHLGMRPELSPALRRGASLSPRMLEIPGPRGRRCRERLAALLMAPLGDDDDGLARVAVVLAWVDDLYRGNRPADGMRRVVEGLVQDDGPPVWEESAAGVEEHLAAEVASLVAVARGRFPASEAAGAVFGPAFAGSAAVDGADADLIVSGCLYDVKTTINPGNRLAASVRQLLGYVLLDWDDAHRLQRAGFYFARQGRRMSWPLDEVVADAAGDAQATLAGVREELRGLAPSARAA